MLKCPYENEIGNCRVADLNKCVGYKNCVLIGSEQLRVILKITEKQEKVIDDIEKEIRLFKTFAISGVWGKTQKDKCIKIFIEAMQKIIDKYKGGKA